MMKTTILFILATIVPCYRTDTSEEIWKHNETPLAEFPNESFQNTPNSAETLLTDNINEIVQRKNFFDDLWGSLKGPLEQIGKQAVLNLSQVAANALQQAAASAVGKREDVDQTWQEIKTHMQSAALHLWNIVKTALADVKGILQQSVDEGLDKRNILDDLYERIKDPLKQIGKQALQSLVGALLKTFEQKESLVGKRNILDDLYERIKDPLKQIGKQALQSLVGALLKTFEQKESLVGKRNILDDLWEHFKEPLKQAGQQAIQVIVGAATDILNNQTINAVGKRNIFDDIWNRVKGPLTQIAKQMTQALAGMASGALQQSFLTGVGRRSIWKHIWHSIKRPLQATGKQMGKILTIVAAHALTNAAMGKRDVLTDTWNKLKGPLETSVTEIANAIVGEVKNSIPNLKSDLANIKHLIIAELLSVGEQYFNRTFHWLDDLTVEDDERSAGHRSIPGFLQHMANMYGTSLTTENLPALAKLIITQAVKNAQRVIPQLMMNKLHSIMHLLSKITTVKQT